jgi:excisionase family DNA binding protein
MNAHEAANYEAPRMDHLLTVDQVAQRLAVSQATVYRLVAAGQLSKLRIGGSTRFRGADVDALIEGSEDHP